MAITLRLYQCLTLLALDDDTGASRNLETEIAIAAGGICDLVLLGRLRVEDSDDTLVEVLDPTPTGDAILDSILDLMKAATSPARLTDWIQAVFGEEDLIGRVTDGLVADGMLGEETSRFLFVFERKRYPERDHTAEAAIVDQIRAALDGDGADGATDVSLIGDGTAWLVAIAAVTGLLENDFSLDELDAARERIEAIVNRDDVGPATRHALVTVQGPVGGFGDSGYR